MTASTDELIHTLAELRDACQDLRKTHELAAEHLRDDEQRTKVQRYAQQSAQFAGDLSTEIQHLGGPAKAEGSVMGTLHRSFLELRSRFKAGDQQALIKGALRAENMAIEDYERAMRVDLPPNLQTLISNQFADLKQAREELQDIVRKMPS